MNLSSIVPKAGRQGKKAGVVALVTALTLPALLVNCKSEEPPIYKSTPDRVYMGSMLYAKSDCSSCHGTQWKGDGPDAKTMSESGWKTTDFTGVVAAQKTPEDYFMAVTDPMGYFKKQRPQMDQFDLMIFASSHKYLTFTDRGRWAIANFLYSLGQEPEDMGARKEALSQMEERVSAVYAENRRWQVGFTPVSERTARPDLDSMLKKSSFQTVSPVKESEVSDTRQEIALEAGQGADLYRNNCTKCHGRFAEGRTAGPRYGLTGMIPLIKGYPRTEEEPVRQNASTLTSKALKGSAGLASKEAFKSAHNSVGLLAPRFGSFTEEEWSSLYEFTRRLAGQ